MPAPYTAQFNTAEENAVSGTITDNTTNHDAIKDAYVFAWNWIETIDPTPLLGDETYTWSNLYTYTHADGSFKIVPYNYLQPNVTNANRIIHITYSATGAEKGEIHSNPDWKDTPISNSNPLLNPIHLNRSNLVFDATVSGITVPSGTQNFRGWNTLTTTNVTIDAGASSDFTANSEININTEFWAKSGSEVHIYPSPNDLNCPDYSSYLRKSNQTPAEIKSEERAENNIEVDFITNFKRSYLQLMPNPNSGQFNVKLVANYIGKTEIMIRVFDIMGKSVFTDSKRETFFSMDLSQLGSGIYFIQVIFNGCELYQKIIIE